MIYETVCEGLEAILTAHPDLDVVAEAVDGQSAVARRKRCGRTSWCGELRQA